MNDRLTKQLGRSPGRIAVFRALQLGDLLVALPFFRALRRSYPKANITLIGLPWAADFVERYADYIDGFIDFHGYQGLPECEPNTEEFSRFVSRVRAKRFDVAIQLHGNGRITNGIVKSFGARLNCGFHDGKTTSSADDLFAPYPAGHEINRHLRLLDVLGLPSAGTQLEFPLSAADWRQYRAIARQKRLGKNYVCFHAGARYASRRWPADCFAALAASVHDDGFQVVLTGSRDEEELVEAVSHRINRPHVNLAGKTSLGTFAALLRRSRLLVTNDTGASHVAVAVRARSVVIVLGSDPDRWAPLNQRRHAVVFEPIDCRPCEYRDCPIGHLCATSISVERVLEASRRQLARGDCPGSGGSLAPVELSVEPAGILLN